MLKLASKSNNLEYSFPTEHSNGVKLDVRGLPTFINIEKILTEITPEFTPELRMMEFTPEQAKKIQDKILSNYLAEIGTPEAPAVKEGTGTAFPFSTIQQFANGMKDDTTIQVWNSELKLLHIVSRGGFTFLNEGN